MTKFLLSLALLTFSCTSTHRNDIPEGHDRLYSEPEWKKASSLERGEKRIVLVGTNDFAASLIAQKERPTMDTSKKKDEQSLRPVEVGGAEVITAYFKVMRKRYKNILFLDAGNFIQKQATPADTAKVIELYNSLGYDALSLGENELGHILKMRKDHPALNPFKKLKAKIVSSNIMQLSKGQPILDQILPYYIKKIDSINVGILGISSQNLALNLGPHLKGIYIDAPTKSILKYSRKLKRMGAKLIVLNANLYQRCGHNIKQELAYEKRNFDPELPQACNRNDELSRVLKRLPKGTIDAVVVGSSDAKIANYISGIPTIQSFKGGKYLGRIELVYNTRQGQLVSEKTLVYQPTKFCHQFYEETNDCYSFDKSIDHKVRTKARFLGINIGLTPKTSQIAVNKLDTKSSKTK